MASRAGVSVAKASASVAGAGSRAAPCEALTWGGGVGGGLGGATPAAGEQGGMGKRERVLAAEPTGAGKQGRSAGATSSR